MTKSELVNYINECIEEYINEANDNSVKYIATYEKFIAFLKKPSFQNIEPQQVVDICKIIGLSSDKLNAIVAKNLKTGNKIKLDPEWFADSNHARNKIKEIGEPVYNMSPSSWHEDYLVFSVPKQHMYWLNTEHTDIEPFFNFKWTYESEFTEFVIFGGEEMEKLKELFIKYNKEHNINFG